MVIDNGGGSAQHCKYRHYSTYTVWFSLKGGWRYRGRMIKTREKSCYVASEFIALSLLVGIVKMLIFITVDIFKHTAKKNKKIKQEDQILPEMYGTTLNDHNIRKLNHSFKTTV